MFIAAPAPACQPRAREGEDLRYRDNREPCPGVVLVLSYPVARHHYYADGCDPATLRRSVGGDAQVTTVVRWSGREARALRQARRMSIRAFAAHLGVTVATVSNWDSRGELARLRTDTQQMLDTDLARASADVQERFAAILADEDDEMRRRGFIIAGSLAVAGGLTSAAKPLVADHNTNSHARMASSDLSQAILAPKPFHTTEPLDASALAAHAQQAWQLRQFARYDQLGALLSELIPQAEASFRAGQDDERQKAAASLVHIYNAASSLLKRYGDAQLAAISADRAVRMAQFVDAPVLVAAAYFRLANVLLTGGRLDEAESVAVRAADLIEPSKGTTPQSLATWGGLLLTAAVAAARRSDRTKAWELLGEASAASRLLGVDHADVHAIFGPTNVAIHCVQIAVELGDGHDAVRRGHGVDTDSLPSSLVERRGQFLVDMAHAYILTKDAPAATAALVNAERAAPQEIRFNPEAHGMVRTLLSHRHGGRNPELRALAQRIHL